MNNPENIMNMTQGPSPEGEAEKEKIFEGVTFEPIKNKKGEITGYKSSDPSRKVIVLRHPEFKPEPGEIFKVVVREDTNPEDPMLGKYMVDILAEPPEPVNQDVEEWEKVEANVEQAEISERSARVERVKLYKETGLKEADRKGLGKEEIISKSEFPEIVEEALNLKEESEQIAQAILGNEDSPEQALVSLQYANLRKAIREQGSINEALDKLRSREVKILKRIEDTPTGSELAAVQKIREKINEYESQKESLFQSNPEAFYGLHLKDLKKYKDDLKHGRIVETPYVKESIDDIAAHLRANKPVLIYGHLGSGKSELAMHIAKNYILQNRPDIDEKVEKDFNAWLEGNPNATEKERNEQRKEFDAAHRSALVISGSKNMSAAELYGHQVLDIEKINKEELDSFVKDVEQRYNQWLQENEISLNKLSSEEREQEKNRAHERLLQTYLTQFKGGTISDYFLGPIYRAMEEGRPVIIDEVNAIPHEVLISLNHILTRKVGEEINVQQDSGKAVTIKEGYGVMMTGNFNQGPERYLERQSMDPAFLSRLYKLEYDYLPQKTEGSLVEEAGEENELYHLLLSKVMDEHGNIQAPGGTPQKLWDLAKAARITQNVFAGTEANQAYYFKEAGGRGIQYLLKESVLSLRNIDGIINKWQKDGYKRELDYYVYKEFIGQSSTASDRAYLYQLFKDQFGFFASSGWEQNPDYGHGGVVTAFKIKAPVNPPATKSFDGPRNTVEYAYGKPPKRAKWPELKPRENSAEVNPEIEELSKFKDQLEKDMEELKKEIDETCPIDDKGKDS